jgi:RNA polymerase sigma-70 factor (ECF subfamily)
MLRITDTTHDEAVSRVHVEGRLTHATVEELRIACEQRLGRGEVLVDLAGVQFADGGGIRALRALRTLGVVLIGASPFLRRLLADEAAEPAGAPDEPALVAALRAGDPAAFELLVRRHGGRLLATARRLLGNDADARDALQDALLSAVRGIAGFGGGARLSTWLHRIVVNAALMKLRSRRRKREEPIEDLLPSFDDDGHRIDATAGWHTPCDQLLQRQETRRTVRHCIDRLPDPYRTILILRDIEELDTDEAADRLGITPNAAKVRLHRARQALRTLLVRELGDEPADVARAVGRDARS